jgi:hypothetical protein
MHARERIGSGSIHIVVLFLIPRGSLHISTLVGRNIRLIAQRLFQPHREFHPPRKIYTIGTDKEKMACRFPNAIPSGTRVPQWALLDITVRPFVFFIGNVFTAPSTGRLRTIGTQTSLLQSEVRTFFLFPHYQCLTPTSCLLDTPEQAPGVLLGPSGATVSATGTRSGATSSPSGESSSTVKPTSGSSSSSSSKSSSNTGAIVGGAVGGVAIISLAGIAIMFFLRRRRPEAPAPVAPPVFGASQPPMDEIRQPLTMDNEYATSSIPGTIGSSIPGTPGASMRIYVRVPCSVACLVSMRVACSFLPF